MYYEVRKRLFPVMRTPQDEVKDKKMELIKTFGQLKYKRSQMTRAIVEATEERLDVSELSLEQLNKVLEYLQRIHVPTEQLYLIKHPLSSHQ